MTLLLRKYLRSIVLILLYFMGFSPSVLTETLDKQSFFRKSPLLIRSVTTYRNPSVKANYQFTIEIPSDAGLPLQKIKIVQQPNLETIQLFPDETQVFVDQNHQSKETIPIEATLINEGSKNGMILTLSQAVEAGKTIMISLRGKNPQYGGVYQFGITVFPEGNEAKGLYLGVGRLQFSQPGGFGS